MASDDKKADAAIVQFMEARASRDKNDPTGEPSPEEGVRLLTAFIDINNIKIRRTLIDHVEAIAALSQARQRS